jgi:hypothetical protein
MNVKPARLVDAVEQEVEIDETAEWGPARGDPAHFFIVECPVEAEPSLEVVSGPDVVSGEDVKAAQAPQQCVFG